MHYISGQSEYMGRIETNNDFNTQMHKMEEIIYIARSRIETVNGFITALDPDCCYETIDGLNFSSKHVGTSAK